MEPAITLKPDLSQFKNIVNNLMSFKRHTGVGLWSLTGEAMEQLKRTTPRSDKPGTHLADMYTRVAKKDMHGWIEEIIIGTASDHPELLWYLEHGTAPHIIMGNPLLVFEINGQTIFTTIVHHPGTKPYQFVSQTRANLERKIELFKSEVARRTREAVRSGRMS